VKETMTVKERIQWYTEFIEEASKIGRVDPSILKRKQGVVEMLRLGNACDDPEGGAVAYMAVQKRDQEINGSPDNDDAFHAAAYGITSESQSEFYAWFNVFCETLSYDDE
jgi:hypothetical protein